MGTDVGNRELAEADWVMEEWVEEGSTRVEDGCVRVVGSCV